MSNKPRINIKLFHLSVFVKPFVKMSEHCCFVQTYVMRMFPSCCTTLYNHDRLARCVLEICRIGVALPFKTSCIVASLSSHIVSFIWLLCVPLFMSFLHELLPWESPPALRMPGKPPAPRMPAHPARGAQWQTESQKSSTGSPSTRRAHSMAMISVSVELWLTALCPLDATAIGANV